MNPLLILVSKQAVGAPAADLIELPVLIYFDAARRGQLPAFGYNCIAEHLVMAYYLSVRLKSPSFKLIAEHAGNAWRSAGGRPTGKLDLSKREYRAVRAALGVYFRHLPYVELGMYREAYETAIALMHPPKENHA